MIMDGSWTDKGLSNYMRMRILKIQDEAVITGYINKSLIIRNYDEAERIIV